MFSVSSYNILLIHFIAEIWGCGISTTHSLSGQKKKKLLQ